MSRTADNAWERIWLESGERKVMSPRAAAADLDRQAAAWDRLAQFVEPNYGVDRSPTHALAAALEPGGQTKHDDTTGES